ncbi:MAG TPA: HAD family hydrolase [Anaerolineae bacterium]|nr:HAD family hydrolase [Anaerolineae bacterium]HQI83843.1 HAD family hydrolase [Anaerolineae bacterium]
MLGSQTMRYLLWDFDGTLGYRGGGAWTAALLETLDLALPDHTVTFEQLRPYMQVGFPWHQPEHPHLHLTFAEAWWEALYPILARAYRGVGLDESLAGALARQFRAVYLNLYRWRLFDDVLPALDALSARGWTHAILSNHVPELGDIVRHLGLTARLARVFNSAETGYEKPHPRAFQTALETLPDVESVWMIGDNVTADVQGAEAVGLPAILVRRQHPQARYCCETLYAISAYLFGVS